MCYYLTMEQIGCDFCGTKFYRKRSQILYSKNHYCSDECRYSFSKKGKMVNCSRCNKEIYKSPKDLSRSKSKKYFCSQHCANTWIGKIFSREKHPNWKGGKHSYKEAMLRLSQSPKCVFCKDEDKRILAVHHIDKDRNNNNLKNLMWLCHNCHFLIHHYSREQNKLKKIHANS